jgi:hydroxymethylglutaryl-CoA reductase (NADPH)
MTTEFYHLERQIERLRAGRGNEDLRRRLAPKRDRPAPNVPRSFRFSRETVDSCWGLVNVGPEGRAAVADSQALSQLDRYQANIENFIGTVKVPVGLAGPLRVNGLFAQGDYYVPLATTEAALVASYSRGAQLISEAGGCTAMLLNEGVSRAPAFAFADLAECGQFVAWAVSQVGEFRRRAEVTTRHGALDDVRVAVEGNHVYLNFEFTTGDASGQNMVAIATEAICAYIQEHSPIRPHHWFLEANLSGDKKASAQSFLLVRGKKVTAEILLPADLVCRRLHTTPGRMDEQWRMAALGGVLSGTMGVQGHFANGLAALYIACGQDAACVSESAVGVTRFEVTDRGELYAAVTLPNLMVGTVGGGTGLPSQQACLDILGLAGPGKAQALAEVCAGLCLAGELSIAGALCAGDFSRAHQILARRRTTGAGKACQYPIPNLPEGRGSTGHSREATHQITQGVNPEGCGMLG